MKKMRTTVKGLLAAALSAAVAFSAPSIGYCADTAPWEIAEETSATKQVVIKIQAEDSQHVTLSHQYTNDMSTGFLKENDAPLDGGQLDGTDSIFGNEFSHTEMKYKCSFCKGLGTRICPSYDGSGSVTCMYCSGSGYH